jgi:hypothetical protein
MNANREWVEAEEISGFESARFGLGKSDSLNSILPLSIRVHWRSFAVPTA